MKYVKILWQYDDYALPHIMELQDDIKNLDELKMILESGAVGKNKVLAITHYIPKRKYLNLYIEVITGQPDHRPMLMLSLSVDRNEKVGDNWAIINAFGIKHEANEMIFDVIRTSTSTHESIVKEDNTKLYFQEFTTDNKGRYNSILEIISGIMTCINFNIPESDRSKAALMEISEN